jgi:hypothetical protein
MSDADIDHYVSEGVFAGRADLLELFHPEFQLYFPKFGIKRGAQAFTELVSGFADVYLDPDYVSEDEPRFRWGREGRTW